ncbi:uncharacterized protein LOC117115268 [Anneissia japonica]|uniref:uncharacterized protein LOC117115268 n=1 Tax=Anneissia japonica TaxID=1529436 RepID=UPI0014259449|nr:uncharacterized protein LOC117115268 [Anneissia japonica]
MWRYFTSKGTNKYIDALPKLISSYNNSKHRSIGTAPTLVTKENEHDLWQTLYGNKQRAKKQGLSLKPVIKFVLVDVKCLLGYLANRTEEIFTISNRKGTPAPTYKVKDWNGEEIDGTFYEKELQKVSKTDKDTYRVEKVLRKRKRNGKTEYFVKWLGYPSKFNSWVQNLVR